MPRALLQGQVLLLVAAITYLLAHTVPMLEVARNAIHMYALRVRPRTIAPYGRLASVIGRRKSSISSPRCSCEA